MKRLSLKTWIFIIFSTLGITALNLFLTYKDGKLTPIRTALTLLMSVQLVAWAWFQSHKGDLPDKQFLIFSAGMLIGPLAAGAECLITKAWSVLMLQLFFFSYSAYGAIQRFQAMRKQPSQEKETS